MYHRSHDWGSASRGHIHPGWGSASGGGRLDRTPQIHGILRDVVNKRAVCIRLECFLVLQDFPTQGANCGGRRF